MSPTVYKRLIPIYFAKTNAKTNYKNRKAAH